MGNGIQYKQASLKANLQMAVSRLTLMKNKRLNQISTTKCEIADLLQNGKEEMAMVKVESIINNENFNTAIEVLIMFCVQLNERVFQITAASQVPNDLDVAIQTVIWASCKIDCKELVEVRQNIGAKFGFDYCRGAADNKLGQVNNVVRDKLVTVVPTEEEKVVKIQQIASEKRIDYVFKHHIRLEIQNSSMPNGGSSGFPSSNYPPPPSNFPPPSSNYPPPPSNYPPPSNFPPSHPPPGSGFGGDDMGFPPAPPSGGFPPKHTYDKNNSDLPSVPTSGFRDFDIDSLEDRFKKLK